MPLNSRRPHPPLVRSRLGCTMALMAEPGQPKSESLVVLGSDHSWEKATVRSCPLTNGRSFSFVPPLAVAAWS